jgi:hypothetical protein
VDRLLVDVVDKDEKPACYLACWLSTLSTTPKSLFCYIFEGKKFKMGGLKNEQSGH